MIRFDLRDGLETPDVRAWLDQCAVLVNDRLDDLTTDLVAFGSVAIEINE